MINNKTIILLSIILKSCISDTNIKTNTQLSVDPEITLEKKIRQFKDSLKLNPNNSAFLFKIAAYHAINKENDSSFKYLNLATKIDSTGELFENGEFYTLFNDSRWLELEKYVFNKEFKKLKLKDTHAVKELWRCKIKDQSYYTEVSFYERKLGYGNRISDSIFRLRGKVTPGALLFVLKLIDKIGWPSITEYTARGSAAVFYLIQHSNDSIMRKYLPLLETACKKKEANYEYFAKMKDRILLHAKKPQLYGTHYDGYDEKNNNYTLSPTEDTLNLDKRRAEIGLEPIKKYYKATKISYSTNF